MTAAEAAWDPSAPTGSRRWRRLRTTVWRRKVAIVLPLLMAAPIAWALDQRAPTRYRASATVFLNREDVTGWFEDGGGGVLDARSLQTEVELIRGPELRALVEAGGSVGSTSVDAQPVSGADAVTMAVVGPSADAAAELANRFADRYVANRRAERAEALRAQADDLRLAIDELQGVIDASRTAEGATPSTSGAAQRANDRAQQSGLQHQLDLLDVQRGLVNGGAEVIRPADADDAVPVDHGRTAALATLGLGLLAGIGWAVGRERFDDRLHSVDHLASISTPETAVFVIPASKRLRAGDVLAADDTSPVAESFRGLRALLPSPKPGDAAVVQITSAGAAEGRRTVTANLGSSSARAGWYTILVEGDVSNPHLDRVYGVADAGGLGGLIEHPDTPAVTALAMPTHRRLGVMVAGSTAADPGDLVSLPAVGARLVELRARADVVLVDSGSLRSPDALVWAHLADATVVLVRSGRTRRSELRDALDRLQRAGASVVAVVLVGARTDRLGCPL